MGKGKVHSYSSYVKLLDSDCCKEENGIRKGYVPVLVGKDDQSMERHHIPTKLMEHPYIVDLLDMSASEFGYSQQGLIKIQYDADCFRQMVKRISKERR